MVQVPVQPEFQVPVRVRELAQGSVSPELQEPVRELAQGSVSPELQEPVRVRQMAQEPA